MQRVSLSLLLTGKHWVPNVGLHVLSQRKSLKKLKKTLPTTDRVDCLVSLPRLETWIDFRAGGTDSLPGCEFYRQPSGPDWKRRR